MTSEPATFPSGIAGLEGRGVSPQSADPRSAENRVHKAGMDLGRTLGGGSASD